VVFGLVVVLARLQVVVVVRSRLALVVPTVMMRVLLELGVDVEGVAAGVPVHQQPDVRGRDRDGEACRGERSEV